MSDYLSFHLPDEFVRQYEEVPPDWGFPIGGGNFLSELTFVNKYSAIKEDGTKERWFETCRRCIEGMYSILKDHSDRNRTPWNTMKALASAKDAYDRMFHFKWMPPGRGLQHMGRDLVHKDGTSNVLQNCFTGDTDILTLEYGPVNLAEIVDEEVTVIGASGEPTKAMIRAFGEQSVQIVTMKPFGIRTNIRQTVLVTPNHRWILDSDETTSLKVEDRIKGQVNQSVPLEGEAFWKGFFHGMIFADGNLISHRYANGDYGYEFRACGSRKRGLAADPHLKGMWDKVNWDRPSCNGDPIYSVRSTDEFKEFPTVKDPAYLRGFVDGWISCDGSKSTTDDSVKLDSVATGAMGWLESNAALAGYTLIGHSVTTSDSNFGPRKPLHRFTLYRGSHDWKVESIIPLDVETDVFCAVVPDGAAFTLPSGVLTGNCAFLSTAKISTHSAWEAVGPFSRMMEMSMNGIGCIAEGSWVTTSEGPVKIENIRSETSVVLKGEKCPAPVGAWSTGVKDVVKVTTVEGYELVLTPDHRVKTVSYSRTTNNRLVETFEWVEAQDLADGVKIVLNEGQGFEWMGQGGTFNEGYLVGACFGDGWKDANTWTVAAYTKDPMVEGIKAQCLEALAPSMRREHPQRKDWKRKTDGCETLSIGTWVGTYLDHKPKVMRDSIEESSFDFYRGFLRGLFDADGHVVDGHRTGVSKGNAVVLSQSNFDTLRRVQRMLLRLGVKSSIITKRTEPVRSVIVGRKTVSNPAWSLTISRSDCLKFRDVVGFSDGHKKDLLDSFSLDRFYTSRYDARVKSVESCGKVETFDMTVPTVEAFDANGLYVHNCGFDVKGAGRVTLHDPSLVNRESFTVPDSREGWARTIEVLLESHFFKNRGFVDFDYSEVRPAGAPLKSFGGRASGPQPLMDCIEMIRTLLDGRGGEKITSRDIVDIMNLIGKAVVAGGARRCLPSGSLVKTTKGLVPIESLVVGDMVETPRGVHSVTNVFDQGVQDVVVVRHAFGEFECTPNHRMAVWDSPDSWTFKEASLLGPEDRLVRDCEPTPGRVPVVEVVSGRSVQTWDIEVDEIHQFTVEGFVSHNSAQIAFGSVEDEDYVTIKDWNLPQNKERTAPDDGWGWNSNNSVFVEGEISSSLIESTVLNGEPGYMWLELAQQYGRMVDPPTGADWRVMGSNPCCEQSLEGEETCTLVESFPSKHETFEDYRQTLKAAYLYGKAVTLLSTTWPQTNEVMARNRRIGCSMSGLAEFVESRGWGELRRWMDEGYQFICHRDKKYSEWLAVRESIKKTSIKPSGTVSIVASVTPGVHWPVSAGSHIRRVRYSVNDPMVERLKKAGFPVEPMQGDPKNTVVVTFVTKSAEVRDQRHVSIWEKAELAVMAQRWWADNQVSATLSFLPDEEDQIAPLLASKSGQIKGTSFLPLRDEEVYAQAPYEPIEAATADSFVKKIRPLGDLYSMGVDAVGDRFCDTDVCVI